MDDGSFVAGVAPHLAEMLRVAAVLVGPAEAEDAVQEACVRAWQGWGNLRDREALRAWLLRITVNVCRNWLSGRFGTRRNRTASLDGELARQLALPGSDPGSSDHARALDLHQALARLEEDLRVVVVLRYFAGLDASEIGAALEVPPSTVRTRLRRALAQLRDRLQADASLSAPAREGDAP
jgi:RNA polymerase sigma-70 factor (ECF subfamily)